MGLRHWSVGVAAQRELSDRMTLDLEPLHRRYPEHRDMIDRRVGEDGTFREMCEDYAEMYRIMREQRGTSQPKEQQRLRAYEELLAELGAEIMHALHGQHPEARPKRDDAGRHSDIGT